jgi:hypothetical protein
MQSNLNIHLKGCKENTPGGYFDGTVKQVNNAIYYFTNLRMTTVLEFIVKFFFSEILCKTIDFEYYIFKLMDFLLYLTLFTVHRPKSTRIFFDNLMQNSVNYSFGVKNLCAKGNVLF